jgi:hypothetical protein
LRIKHKPKQLTGMLGSRGLSIFQTRENILD